MNASVPVEIVGNKVILPNYIKYPYDHRFRDYSINYELVIPQNAVVIPLKKDQINFDGDTDGNGINDNDEEDNDGNQNGNISIEKNKISINGSTIEYSDSDKDSVIINGKKYQKDEAEKIMDTMKMNIDKMENVDIKIKDGKKEFSIKTK
ncbi:hypothetical protein CHRY9390_03254 [Chryseobacterium aquaeductus]|uniref:Uncharacterized protein n=1 Tax=Chryseobacterium aquaeductus TaxID=2675056 RepID=A0A9N8QRX2_9FLAO|nr:hypothetical protein CHRY9390_03254 [Chryseobacterium potabilaquae]CAD7823500.1 hypothetical protein CHRY9390_03254 [Chryseobacterium aquaeductus]